jgi:putative aminopeptidase FrvX
VLSYAPAVQINLNKLLVETAQKNEIPFQRQASSRSTGTDTDAFAYSNAGVPSALISLPLRYMHTTVEMIHKHDVDNVIRLIFETLKALKPGQDFRTFAK